MTVDKKMLAALLADEEVEIISENSFEIDNARSVQEAGPDSITWIKPGNTGIIAAADGISAGLIICNNEMKEQLEASQCKTTRFVVTEQPKKVFSKIVNHIFTTKPEPSIHPGAWIAPGARIGRNAYIGPFACIGNCTIGDNAVIHGNCHIFDGVTIGDNVQINPGVVIGSDGFGYARDENGTIEKFPHLGSVVIGNDVEIGANTCIDRGALGNTIISSGVKIDNLVHIAHNVFIGENAFIIANAMLGGSARIGTAAWIAPSVSTMQQINIGAHATIGMGAVVTKNVPENEVWTGAPAKPLSDFISIQKAQKEWAEEMKLKKKEH